MKTAPANEWTLNLKHWFYDYHLLMACAAIAIAFILSASVHALRTSTVLYPVIGGILGVSYFVTKQRLEEICLLKDLFGDFNERYGKMNEGLNALLKCDRDFNDKEKAHLEDYFNLCAEEYFYYSKGFVYPSVWYAWRHGMKTFADNPRIRAYWEKELKSDSYYGFSISFIEHTVKKASHGQHKQNTPYENTNPSADSSNITHRPA